MPPQYPQTADAPAGVVLPTATPKIRLPSGATSIASPVNIFGVADAALAPPFVAPEKGTLKGGAPITKDALLQLLPTRLKERSLFWSMSYVLRDVVAIAVLGFAATRIRGAPPAAQWALWPLYWWVQGTFMTGVWVLAHECGHQAFSNSKWVNDTVGWVLHSALLVPYHSWRISHKNHHSNTCSMEHDEVFVPSSRKDFAVEMISESPLASAWGVVVMLLFGWPAYISVNITGPEKNRNKPNSHFQTDSALFENEDESKRAWHVIVSNIGFFGAVAAIAASCWVWGAQAVAAYYFVPYLVVNLYLVLITFLQHTDEKIAHYRGAEFTWLRGALSTVDRSYGWLIDEVIHHIADTHVVHHLFHEVPFYNAVEATCIVRDALGPYYLSDHTSIPYAVLRTFHKCKFVEDKGGVVHYKDAAAFNKGPKAA